jgi:hypothetical protein
MNKLVPYHFFLIWMNSLLATAAHNATLLALVQEFRQDRILLWMRQILMCVNMALSCVYGIFILQSTAKRLPATLPIACTWQENIPFDPEAPNPQTAYIGTILVIAGNVVVFLLATWYLQTGAQRFKRIARAVGWVAMAAIAISATVRAFLLSQAFGSPNVELSDMGERDWNYGQLLAVMLLFMPVITVIEIWRGRFLLQSANTLRD